MRRLGSFVIAFVVLLAVAPTRAQAQDAGERITSFDFVATIQDDGDLAVQETITYDFGAGEHHGIFRDIPTRLAYDDTHERVYPLTDVTVSSSTAPDDVSRESGPGGTTRLRIGDPNTTVTGTHVYTISYVLGGALNAFDDHVELYWNAIGTDWPVPIADATARIQAPVPVDRVACFAGPVQSSNPCERSSVDGRIAAFTQAQLSPYEGLTFVVSVPPGSVTATGPVLEEIWSPERAFSLSGGALAGFGALLGLVVAGVGALAWRVGRDRRSAGSAVDVAFGDTTGGEERVPLLGRGEVPVEYEPPDGLRPGQVGTLIDERANPLDVTATVVDLAVRGYLRIEEIEKSGWFSKADWRLTRLDKDDAALLPYERELLDGLFESGTEVELSDLKNKFATRLHKVQRMLYTDAIEHRWFAGSPDKVRAMWIAIGIGVVVLGIGLTVAAAAFTGLGIVPIPIVIGGFLLVVLSGRMPHRTSAGTGVLVRTLGFKRFIDESEQERARFAEQQHLFTEYLPYAVVFGATEKWAKAFAGLDGELPDQSSWYVSNHPFTFIAFSHAMDGFATTTAGTIASTPSGSGTSGFGGGGFSGGGGGGGGGGSW